MSPFNSPLRAAETDAQPNPSSAASVPEPIALQSNASIQPSFSRKLVLTSLEKMTKGHLVAYLPDGSVRHFGKEPDSAFRTSITIHRESFFSRVIQFGHIGFAEGYMDGDWDTPDLEMVVAWFILNVEESPLLEGASNHTWLVNLLGKFNRWYHLLRSNTQSNSQKNIHEHYDLGNAFFKLFLDPTLTYSSAYYTQAEQSLESAQLAKYDALCRKLKLTPGDHVLEIGSGWGGFAQYASETYGCKITTTTISREQFAHVQHRIQAEGLQDRIEILYCDYRNLTGKYDKIVSIEMIEAVGDQYYEAFFAQCHRLLKPQGLVALQMITCPDSRFELLKQNVDFIQKHIFPGSLLPSVGRINQAVNRTSHFFLHSLEDMGNSYARTLGEWHVAFNQQLEAVRALGFDERFIRKWNLYFLYCKAAFRMRNISVVQVVYTRPNNLSLYSEIGL